MVLNQPNKSTLNYKNLLTMNEQFHIEYFTPSKSPYPFKILAHRELDPDSMAHINPYADENRRFIQTYEITFPTYITFSVIGDMVGMALCSEDDMFEGDSFRIYSQSLYYDMINKSIPFKEHFNEKVIHYGFLDIWHQIDILSFSQPIVKEIHLHKGIYAE
ncbi:hypothetical protein AC622_09275 [Bacillus sp. FJAT-27916]|uniref:hypothetical protein n=1 Tax=Bacillus sp. FJAT-27916 TaxID=1679169 RepID=UPI0006707F1A|nr:hypothetical protein [Bacillus sp. FJAT-27916]KMY44416.1 hypothetical protein AC622_09275 [Bacillus sp. FJAT-27916]